MRRNLTLMRTYVRNMGIGNHRRLSGDMRKPGVEDMAMGWMKQGKYLNDVFQQPWWDCKNEDMNPGLIVL